ncbi:hypothetical protein BGZ60DRAFT_466711 [Tricladium varicosporioides]|nr:hypothetical protein BGZ60DRAFT_466711 [Hymenoscyphus varicosporioides]
MRPRLPIRRILFLRPFRPPNTTNPRFFALNSVPRTRPNLPYLSSTTIYQPRNRYLTTETKIWLKSEVKKGLKITAYVYTFFVLATVIAFGVHFEIKERAYNPAPEWSWITRQFYHSAKGKEDEETRDVAYTDYAAAGQYYLKIIARLEDPNIDGAGLIEQGEGGILVEGIGKTGYDIANKSEPWRRGYYESLMGAARAAEHLEDCVIDTKRGVVFPRSMVMGSSNPNPRPVPVGAYSAPKEEDCEPFFAAPETFYMKILTTSGFTEKQRVDAALAYGAWLDFKNSPNTALEMYKWALDIAASSSPQDKPPSDPKTHILSLNTTPPSENLLTATTALAIHHATTSNLSLALPIFLSVLRARRSLPEPPPSPPSQESPSKSGIPNKILDVLKSIFIQPPFPPSPPDGTHPPVRTAHEKCLEAGLMTNIGEILYASQSSSSNSIRSREDGLAWTREAVDIAEEQLRLSRTSSLQSKSQELDKEGRKACKQCLQVALENWEKMVGRLAREEREGKIKGRVTKGSWWAVGKEDGDVVGRWGSEEGVVRDRKRRIGELLDIVPAPDARGVPWKI